jgi:ribosome modulation factor
VRPHNKLPKRRGETTREESAAYRLGYQARARGELAGCCPYQSGSERVDWLTGWQDCHIANRLREVFDRYEVQFP